MWVWPQVPLEGPPPPPPLGPLPHTRPSRPVPDSADSGALQKEPRGCGEKGGEGRGFGLREGLGGGPPNTSWGQTHIWGLPIFIFLPLSCCFFWGPLQFCEQGAGHREETTGRRGRFCRRAVLANVPSTPKFLQYKKNSCEELWETDFYTPPMLGGVALFDNSAAAVYKNTVP